jgi:nitrogen regulatory protein P-II 1
MKGGLKLLEYEASLELPGLQGPAEQAPVPRSIAMIRIEATIKPFMLDKVREALGKLGVSHLGEYQVSDFGAERSHKEIYRGVEYVVESVPRVRLDMLVPESMEDQVVQVISASAQTTAGADGTILVIPVGREVPIGSRALREKAS